MSVITNMPALNPDCQSISSANFHFTWAKKKASEHRMCTTKTWVSKFLLSTFKSLLQSRLTLRQLYLECVNPGELDVASVESRQETWDDETWSIPTQHDSLKQDCSHVSSDLRIDRGKMAFFVLTKSFLICYECIS